MLTAEVLAPLAGLRPPHSDKRSYGHLFVVGGSTGFPGAVLMTALAFVAFGLGTIASARALWARRRELRAWTPAERLSLLALSTITARSLPDLRRALRSRFPGAFDLITHEPATAPWQVIVSFHPPPGEPNPDRW